MRAVMLVSTEPGKFDDVVERVGKMSGVKDAFAVAGRADVVVLVDVRDLKQVSDLALEIFSQPGVTASETLLEVER